MELQIWITWWNLLFFIYNEDYFEYITRKHETIIYSTPVQIYINNIDERVTFVIESGYYLELFSPETMKLFESKNIYIKKDKNG